MKIDKEFFKEHVRLNLFVLGDTLYAVVSHREQGLISQEIATTNSDGKVVEYFLN